MTAEQHLRKHILLKAWADGNFTVAEEITAANVDALYEAFIKGDEDGMIGQYAEELREGQVETGLPCEWSRHYESKAVAAKMENGQWVGWTYWYGGGKHGEPEAIDWMDEAYFLDCTEEQKVVTVQTFTKQEPA